MQMLSKRCYRLPTMLIAFFHIYYPQRCLHWTHELRFDKKSGIVLYLLEKIGWIRGKRSEI
jgi:hypothetical protein